VVSKSLRVTPHQTTRFCQNCHPFDPPPIGTPNAVAPLWEEDVTRLCRGCHEKEGALRMHHPMTAPSEAVGIPEGWKLRKDGSLGCQTCHQDGHGPPDPQNPNMLRGGPYREANESCFKCHDRNNYVRRNIHREVGEFGGCEFCHIVKERTALRPEGKVGDLLAEPNFLCLLCHTVLPHPASADHTIRPKKYSFLSLDENVTPLSLGKITCHTCHDSHSSEVGGRLLRKIGSATLICNGCHPF
jgi:predicted CXXCH cytochrome family protein